MLHGWIKSYKSFLALDLMSSLAQAEPWACFEPTEEPARIGVVQFEIKWPYYRARFDSLYDAATNRDAFEENFYTYTPTSRPLIIAGNTKAEDELLRETVDSNIHCILFDPVRRMMGEADMNAEHEVRRVLAFFERLNNEGITVIACHHDNKAGARGGSNSPISMTGSGAFGGDPDTIVSVEVPYGETQESHKRNLRFTLRNGMDPSPRGMEMLDTGQIEYTSTAWAKEDEDALPAI